MTLLLTVLIFVSFIALMAIGVMFSRRPIQGSCGGLSKLKIARECDCKDVCEGTKRTLYQIKEPD
ncbi:(Na+)-NQR maturation NqrM [Vibrio bivalvicida]|uniref:(Na+)-NQR maturation NqrM n=1 Tax=Vibrio bivalvicida TaxID=1276888 RepID=A0ABV4MP68_9VIBR